MSGLLGKLGMSAMPTPDGADPGPGSETDDLDNPDDTDAPDEAQSAAGEELAEAIKSGDGAAIFQAVKAIIDASKDY